MSKSTKAKVIKNKKKFNFGKIVPFLKTLYKNDAVMEVSASTKWYWSIFVFIFSTLVSIIPSTVQASQIVGSNVLTNSHDAFENGLCDYVENSSDKEIITIDPSGKVSSTQTEKYYDSYFQKDSVADKILKPVYTYKAKNDITGSVSNILDIYVYDGNEINESSAVSKELNGIINSNTNFADGLVTDEAVKYTRTNSFILFANGIFYCRTYVNGTASATLSGDYEFVNEAFDFAKSSYTLKQILTNNGKVTDVKTLENRKSVYNNFGSFCDKVYVNTGWRSTWTTFGIYCALNGGIMIIMGLVVFLMTRGKNNPNRTIKLLQSYGIAFWSSASPAILTLMIGFMIPSFSMMAFIVMYAFRIMFLSTKQLRAAYPAK